MPLPSAETTPPVTKTYFVCPVSFALTGCLPQASTSRNTGVRSISAPSDRRSPRRVRPASAAIALQRCLSVNLPTELET